MGDALTPQQREIAALVAAGVTATQSAGGPVPGDGAAADRARQRPTPADPNGRTPREHLSGACPSCGRLLPD